MNDIPFSEVYIHGTVRDITGKKMSKSLGNVIDPLNIIDEYGTDALRYTLITATATGQDIFLAEEKFQSGRNFANKIWNATRFVIMNLKQDYNNVDLCQVFNKENLKLPERWVLSRLYHTLDYVEKRLNNFHFNDAAKQLYEFFWHEFCDWYLELAKFNIEDKITQIVIYKVLEKSLRLLHPFMPYISEELWQRLPGAKESIMIKAWPHLQKDLIDKSVDKKMDLFFEIVTTIRNLRKHLNIDNSKKISLIIAASDKKDRHVLEELSGYLSNILKLESIKLGLGLKKPTHAVVALIKNFQVFVPLEGLIDFEKENERIDKQVKELKAQLDRISKNLKNRDFLKRAPRDIVDKEKIKKQDLDESLNKLRQIQNAFK